MKNILHLLGDGQHCLVKASVDYVKGVNVPHDPRVKTSQQHQPSQYRAKAQEQIAEFEPVQV